MLKLKLIPKTETNSSPIPRLIGGTDAKIGHGFRSPEWFGISPKDYIIFRASRRYIPRIMSN